ncbi:hypothetical protein OPQ81_003843 [Rhizoctonia solani]|nr:hypothetical protein OPQ81_003843 [Rhizoctonia solani]
MIAGRLASILLFVLSWSLLVCAAPGAPTPRAVANRRDSGSLAPLTTLEGVTRKQLDSCINVKSVEEAKDIIAVMVANIKTTTESLSKSGEVNINSTAETDVAVRVASIITLIVKLIFKLSQKLGSDVITPLCGEIDVALNALLEFVAQLVTGILPTVANKLADVKTEAILKVDLVECATLLGLA